LDVEKERDTSLQGPRFRGLLDPLNHYPVQHPVLIGNLSGLELALGSGPYTIFMDFALHLKELGVCNSFGFLK
jgi:hypothetical protein